MRIPSNKSGRHHPRGLSIIELLMALVVSGIVLTIVTWIARRPVEFFEAATSKMDSSALLEIRGRELTNQFASSYPMRRGFFTCNGTNLPQLANLLENPDEFPRDTFDGNVDVNPPFTFAFSAHSSLAGVDRFNTTRLSVTDLAKFPPGAWVLLTSLNVPTWGGLFEVDRIDGNRVVLKDDLTAVPAAFNCTRRNLASSMAELLNSNDNRVFGNTSFVFRADIIRFATLETRVGKGNVNYLNERIWPMPTHPGREFEMLVMMGFTGIRFQNSRWVANQRPLPPANPNALTADSNGTFETTIVLRVDERSLASAKLVVQKQQLKRARYNTLSGGQVNFGAMTIPPTSTAVYPGCGVLVTTAQDLVVRDDNKFSRFYRIKGSFADVLVPSGITLSMNGPAADPPRCWQNSDLQPLGGHLVAPTAAGRGRFGTITLHPGTSGGFTPIFCEATGGATFSGTLRYFNADLKRLLPLSCGQATAPTPPAGEAYSYLNGRVSTCLKSGEISIGTLIRTGSSDRGPALYLTPDSCTWSASSQRDCAIQPGRGDLNKVKFFPTQIPGFNTNEINCT